VVDGSGVGTGFSRLRITVTSGAGPFGSERGDVAPTLVVTLAEAAPWPATTSLATVPWTRNENSAIAGLKTTSYAENAIALADAKRRGASEAILADAGAPQRVHGQQRLRRHRRRGTTPSLDTGYLWRPEARPR
jgi:branched-chain amino acid aminotransferase